MFYLSQRSTLSSALTASILFLAAPTAAQTPTAEAPAAEAPAAETPTAEAPTAEAPVTEAPTAEAPVDDEANAAAAAETAAEAAALAAKRQVESSSNIKLRQIEENVNSLKDKIYRSKARLTQLEEMVLHGTISGAKAVLVHRNEMGSSYRLLRVQYALDGTPILTRADSGSGELDEVEEIEIFNGSIAPGNHNLSVFLQYKGNGYGVFKYLEKYDFKLKSSHAFTVEEGKQTTIKVIAFEKGGITTPMNERPAIKYDVSVASDLRATGEQDVESIETESATPQE